MNAPVTYAALRRRVAQPGTPAHAELVAYLAKLKPRSDDFIGHLAATLSPTQLADLLYRSRDRIHGEYARCKRMAPAVGAMEIAADFLHLLGEERPS